MSLGRVASVCAASLALAVVAACAPEAAPPGHEAGTGLAPPTFEPTEQRGGGKRAGKRARPDRAAGDRKESPRKDGTGGSRGERPTRPPTPSGTPKTGGGGSGTGGGGGSGGGTGPLRAAVTDGRGDVGGGLTRPPAYVDLVQAVLVKDGEEWTLTAEFAAAVPSRAEDGKAMNVVGYLDTDGDGSIDHELLGHLSDSGWSGSHRSPDGARFGSSSGVRVSASGSTVVLRFGAELLPGVGSLQWAVASEWGSHEQVALGTTATDHAPDTGAVAFPG